MWDIFSKILNIILILLTLYFYLENRKLSGFEIDKNLEIKKLELQELRAELKKRKEAADESFVMQGLYHSEKRIKAQQNLDEYYEPKIKKLESEIKYLEKLKKYKWFLIFSK